HGTVRNAGAPMPLVAGQKYEVKLEYFENVGNAEIRLLWAYPGQSEQAIPEKYLYPSSNVTFVSDLAYKVIANGWGPVEKDRSNGEQAAGDGKLITINGITFPKGLGAHAASDVRITLDGT